MKSIYKILTICFLSAMSIALYADNAMGEWQVHYSYMNSIDLAIGSTKVYCRNNGALFSVDKTDEEIITYSKTNGLSSANIVQIGYDPKTMQVVVMYQNGHIDLIDSKDNIYNISDLYLAQTQESKSANSLYILDGVCYAAMPFGIIAINLKKKEIADTYYIGAESTAENILSITHLGDSLYAATANGIYTANFKDNLVDYTFWHYNSTIPTDKPIQKICTYNDQLLLLNDSTVYIKDDEKWVVFNNEHRYRGMNSSHCKLILCSIDGSTIIEEGKEQQQFHYYIYTENAGYDPTTNAYWFANHGYGMGRIDAKDITTHYYTPQGPASNTIERMHFVGQRLYAVSGGRWATQYFRRGYVMTFQDGYWGYIDGFRYSDETGVRATDFMEVASLESDPAHTFVASYGSGLYEFRRDTLIKRYTPDNSPLISAVSAQPDLYTRTDAVMYDSKGNLWLINNNDAANNIHVISPEGKWYSYNIYDDNNKRLNVFTTSGEYLFDKRDEDYKWIPIHRPQSGIVLFYDGTTPYDPSDDKAIFQSEFTDQDNNILRYEYIYCMAQDHQNDIWVGTTEGIFVIEATTDWFTSNRVKRIKLSRTDGSGLADYLLNEDIITAIAIDGADRKWIGTQLSGVYLISADGQTTIAHYTEDNSPLISNQITSIAINPKSGEVYIGTSGGLVSYRSDASEPEEDFSQINAYPNVVEPQYDSQVSIEGLMDNTTVKITDSAGNLVCQTRSNGGIAVWDIRDVKGRKVRSGVYFVQAVSASGKHAMTKILVIN